MNLIIPVFFYCCLSSSEKDLKDLGLNRDSNSDLCDAGSVLNQLSYQANWEQVVVWVDYKPVNVYVEIMIIIIIIIIMTLF